MEERSWFWRRIGFWFVPVKRGTLRREEWAKIQRLSRSGQSRKARRIMVLVWVFELSLFLWIAYRGARLWSVAGFLYTVILSSLALFVVQRMRISLAQPTLEDEALMEYGEKFEALPERQRGELFQRLVRDGIWGRAKLDEREAELRMHSEGVAYRLLRPGLVTVALAYWAICLLGPFSAVRTMLVITAIAFSWLAMVVLVLPTIVRMWTEPDQAGEPRVVATGPEA